MTDRIEVSKAAQSLAGASTAEGLWKVLDSVVSDNELRFAALYELQDRLATREQGMVAASKAQTEADQTSMLLDSIDFEMTRLWDMYRGRAPLPASMTRESALVRYVDLLRQLRELAKKEGEE